MSTMGGRGGRGGRGSGSASAPITFDDDGNAVTGVTAEGPPPLFPAMRRAPPPPQDPSARDEALLRYRRSLSSAWRNSCYFLDAEPAAKRYPEVSLVRYRDRDAVSEAKRADAGAAKLALLAETNKKWFPHELRASFAAFADGRRARGGERFRRRGQYSGVNDDDDPNVNDPNVTVWNREIGAGGLETRAGARDGRRARRDGDMSRLDRLARLEEGRDGGATVSERRATTHARRGASETHGRTHGAGARLTVGKKRDASGAVTADLTDVSFVDALADDALARKDSAPLRADDELRAGDAARDKKERRDSERLSGKTLKPGDDDDDEMDHANGDEDDWDEEDDYQQGGNFDDDDGYDDEFQDDGEGGDAFF